MMLSKKTCGPCLCVSMGLAVLVAIVCVFAVMGSPSLISVTGGEAQIREMKSVKNSLFAMNNRVNFAGGGIGSVLIVIMIIIMARAAHHTFVKRPRRIVKRERNSQTIECKVVNTLPTADVRLENVLQSRGYHSA